MIPTLEQLRYQCRIDDDSEDDALTLLAKSVIEKAENFTNRRLYEGSVPVDVEEGMLINDDIRLTIMMMVAVLYDNRGEVPASALRSFKDRLESYRWRPI